MALTTVASFRRFSGFDIRDAVTGTADSGTTTTLVDNALTQADDYWNNYTIHVTAGTNIGLSRVVSDFVATSDTITVAPAFPVAIDNTSQYELVPNDDQQLTKKQVDEFITIADKIVLRDVAVWIEKERADGYAPFWSKGSDADEGEINGTNKTFFTRFTPIADTTGDSSVAAADIRVDVLGASDTWSENVTVTSVDDFTGKVILDTAPAAAAERVLITYAYHPNNRTPDTSLLERASNCQIGLQVLDTKSRDMATLGWAVGSNILQNPLTEKRKEWNRVYYETIRKIHKTVAVANDYSYDHHGGQGSSWLAHGELA